MKGEIFNPGQPIKKEDWDRLQLTKEESIRSILSDGFEPGALLGSQESGALPFLITNTGGLTVSVGTGRGLAPADTSNTSGGEVISIASPLIAHDPTAPDTLTGGVVTPVSTGSSGVVLADDDTNYLWVGYLKAVDISETSLHKVTSAVLYPAATDGFNVVVNQSSSAPSDVVKTYQDGTVVTFKFFRVGNVTTVGGSITDIDQSTTTDGLEIARTKNTRVGITIDSAASPATYADGETKFIDDHVNAFGTGLTISPTNVHRNKITDFEGVDEITALTKTYQDETHDDGIIGTFPTTADLTIQAALPVELTGLGFAEAVQMAQLLSGQAVYLSGERFSAFVPVAVSAPFSGDSYFGFKSTDNGGQPAEVDILYTLYVENVSDVLTAKKIEGFSAPAGTMTIATVLWDEGNLNTLVDLREDNFGTIGTKELQTNSVDSATILEADGSTLQDTNSGEGVKTGHIQDDAIVALKIRDDAVITAKILDLNVTTDKLADDAVTEPKIADDAVESKQIADASGSGQDTTTGTGVKTPHIQDGAITLVKLATSLQGFPAWEKFTFDTNDFAAGGQSESIELLVLEAKDVIHNIVIQHTAQWNGVGIIDFTMEVGIVGEEDKYASPFDVFQATGPTVFQTSTINTMENFSVSASIKITARTASPGLISAATTGGIDVYVLKSSLPA